MRKWQYETMTGPEFAARIIGVDAAKIDAWLNELGDQGWELVHLERDASVWGSGNYVGVFKRPDDSSSNRPTVGSKVEK